jgi:hypothetical protein
VAKPILERPVRPRENGSSWRLGQERKYSSRARQTLESLSQAPTEETEMTEQHFPPGWDEERVRRVLAHYEN